MRYFIVLVAALLLLSTSIAQVQVNVNFNLDRQPVWGPTGYDYVEYYYLPDIDVYYNVPLQRYYFYDQGRWIYRSSLPSRFGNFNFFKTYKVVVNEREPWRNHKSYKKKYYAYKDRHDQKSIRDSRDSKYFVNKNHPEHSRWIKEQKNDKENAKGQNRDKKNDNKKKGGQGNQKK
ncbi:MAG: hypothetical protein C0425_04135 [Chlorobiaceae bacterium]|nr:hypothetical protein [Chlorobiaceae bacterium]